MKVVITDEKKQEYQQLFKDFQDLYESDLGNLVVFDEDNADDVRLPIFYKAMDKLVDAGIKPLNKFFRLPLDEPYFTVNMDNRNITVPPAFNNYGLGVAGDANAELVFFEVERFYDTVDLYALVQENGASGCWVQWQNVTSGVSGNSKVIFTDAADIVKRNETTGEEYKVEVMYLGWLITNEMTSHAGTLEFSLRFFKTVDGQITYSISTQKASCPVKATLNLSVIDTTAEDMSDIVYTRPLYSGVINSMDGASARVTTNLIEGEYDLLTSGSTYNEYAEDEAYANGVYVFTVAAESPDGGTVMYQWYKGADIIPGATSNKYAANIAGTYSVRIGNNNEDTGIRWSVSPSVVIPAARAIKFAKTHQWPTGMYSTGTDADTLKVAVCDKETGNAANGTLRYTWTRSELDGTNSTVIASATTDSYKPAVDEEGLYTCSIVNYRNNTTSEAVVTETPAIVRAEPDKPTSVNIRYDADNQVIRINEVAFASGSKSANHADEWKYQWVNSILGRISEANGGKNDRYPVSNLAANSDNSTNYVINVEVSHVVWDDGVKGERKASMATTSNNIVLHVSGTGTNKVITQITE